MSAASPSWGRLPDQPGRIRRPAADYQHGAQAGLAAPISGRTGAVGASGARVRTEAAA